MSKTISQSELNRLVEQLHHLREALRPFAHFAEALPDPQPDPNEPPRLTDFGPAIAVKNPRNPTGTEHVVTFADFRHAKMLLDRLEKDDYQRVISGVEIAAIGTEPQPCRSRVCGNIVVGTEPHNHAGFCSTDCIITEAILRLDAKA